ncbi:hypothetical protein TGME49_262890 [Toxoplasma gondii ME49]|uniref:Histidine kinase/HSP90-like ATPase domain-containing protein n=4 Tax=Toxoplasma gondii TaxID=5811 RepID=A0A2G8YE01_TOXGO|nr:hypothetical protein TGME49_262890 [Toxoplasma gondii ME49]EPT29679.1 hypothetical protein TGME49_262890 [Toxoplasma gondii ME49]KFG35059.1 hypothetical protein TGP89_262890 [Toxoplasma gondii p89]KYF40730.1 hypothetical protein TGARI_262890 [Toxoplasma gondii ARI]PIM05495.1 hypothetical protein TGCOUG_262890 [Toxoplasma gondii COUG]|eukprot:XP_018637137.1 hypothetical protein TGME49_262890 [Toxoplasma gondii ME49]
MVCLNFAISGSAVAGTADVTYFKLLLNKTVTIVCDMSVTGFTEQNGILMVAKELADNAVDACTHVDKPCYGFHPNPRVEVDVRHLLDESFGQLFATSKTNDSSVSGVFGIGLKMAMMYCHRSAASLLRMKVRVSPSEVWRFRVRSDVSGQSADIEDFETAKEDVDTWPWMTEVAAEVKGQWNDEMKGSFLSYITAINFLKPEISLWISTESENVNALTPEVRGNGLLQCLISLTQIASHKVIAQTQQVVNDGGYTVRIIGIAVAITEDSQKQTEWGSVRVLRTFNSMPLLPEDAPVCAIDKATREFLDKKGARFGLLTKKRQRKPPGSMKAAIAAPVEPTPSRAPANTYDRLLGAAYPHRVWFAGPTVWSDIVLVISVDNEEACFGSLCKTYLRESSALSKSLCSALLATFEDFKTHDPAAFMSIAEREMKEAREIYIPQMAQSMAQIICRSDNEEFKNASFMILSVEREPKGYVAPRSGSRAMASEPSERTTSAAKRMKTNDPLEKLTEKLEALILTKLEKKCATKTKECNPGETANPALASDTESSSEEAEEE